MVTDINYVHFSVKLIQCNPVYRIPSVHISISIIISISIEISLIVAESSKWSKNLVGEPLKQ